MSQPARAILFIDGNNWFHGLKRVGVNSYELDYQKVAEKVLGDRTLRGIRFYIGKVSSDMKGIRIQQKRLAMLREQGVDVILGRLEQIKKPMEESPAFKKISQILEQEAARIPDDIRSMLTDLGEEKTTTYVEKQVDVRIAIDMVSMAYRDEYDVAYLLSADGDFVPAVREVQRLEKKVFALSATSGAQLAAAADTYIRIKADWFHGCYQ